MGGHGPGHGARRGGRARRRRGGRLTATTGPSAASPSSGGPSRSSPPPHRQATDGAATGSTVGPGSIVRVVPDVPSFAVDEGFRYRVPSRWAERVHLGSIVRVPLAGRRVRGYVVETDLPEPTEPVALREILGVSSQRPLFDERLLDTVRWAAERYVAPLSVVLAKTAPPNLPKGAAPPPPATAVPSPAPDAMAAEAWASSPGRPIAYLTARPTADQVAGAAAPILETGRSVLVLLPTGEELDRFAAGLAPFGERLLAVGPDLDDRATTAAWLAAATGGGRIVLGTARTALWRVADLGLAVLVEEGRRGFKERATPTLHVRDVVLRRARTEGFGVVAIGPVPTTELLAADPVIVRAPTRTRVWSLVEIVDRNEEPPGGSVVGPRALQAIRAAARRGPVFVFTHRRGYAPAMRCVRCRALRVCSTCGSRAVPGDRCERCGAHLDGCPGCGGRRFEPLGAGVGRVVDELRRSLGADLVRPWSEDADAPTPGRTSTGSPATGRPAAGTTAAGTGPGAARVLVGTERDLVTLPPVELAVIVDADALVRGTNYRAAEEALRTFARVASIVPRGHGRRTLVQTTEPGHPVIAAFARGEPLSLLRAELEQRRLLGLPPAGELIVLEVRGLDEADELDGELRTLAQDVAVLGPATTSRGHRWLLQGRDLAGMRQGLRRIAHRLRESGAQVRIDADPIDL